MLVVDSQVYQIPLGSVLQPIGEPFFLDNAVTANLSVACEAIPDNGTESAFIDLQYSADNEATWHSIPGAPVEIKPHAVVGIGSGVPMDAILTAINNQFDLKFRYAGRCVEPRRIRFDLLIPLNHASTPYALIQPAGKG